ncbi:MAG TPA: hypothetical protein DCQ31_08410, partial [Bacteroidales bacterium]|nr:hypothetical protein [Bacteroidales bacterium]
NMVGIAYGNQLEFTTLAIPQAIAITEKASNISYTGAILNATVNAMGENTLVTFDYGTSTNLGQTIIGTPNTVNGTELKSVSAELTGLT